MGDALAYGQLGQLLYDHASHRWDPDRHISHGRIRTAGLARTHIKASPPIDANNEEICTHDFRRLVRAFPHLGSSVGLLSDVATDAGPPGENEVACDEQDGERLAAAPFGNIRQRLRDILLVFATGELGEKAGLVVAQNAQQGWPRQETLLSTIIPSDEDLCTWNANLGKVRQVVLASIHDQRGKVLLAIRYANALIIARVSDGRLPNHPLRRLRGWLASPSSRLSLELVGQLKDTKAIQDVVDVAFSPFDTYRIATAHTDGFIKVWSVPHLRGRTNAAGGPTHSLLHKHTMRLGGDQDSNRSRSGEWVRVTWIESASYVAAVSRNDVIVFDVVAAEALTQTGSILQEGETVFDASRSPSDLRHMILVTSLHIHWLAFTRTTRKDSHQTNKPALTILQSWKHWRDPGDWTLKLAFRTRNEVHPGYGVSGPETNARVDVRAILFSRSSQLTTEYALEPVSGSQPLQLASIIDPARVGIPTMAGKEPPKRKKGLLSDLLVVPCPFSSRNNDGIASVTSDNTEKPYLDRGYEFHQVFTLDMHLTLSSSIYCDFGAHESTSHALEPLSWTKILPAKTTRSRDDVLALEPFIVDDDAIESEDEASSLSRTIVASFRRCGQTVHAIGTLAEAEEARVVSNAKAYQAVVQEPMGTQQQLSALLDSVSLDTGAVSDVTTRRGTVWQSVCNLSLVLDNLDTADAALANLASRLTAKTVLIPGFDKSLLQIYLAEDTPSLASLYRRSIDHWIVPLPPTIRGATRLARERAVRGMVAAVCLSSIRLAPADQVLAQESLEAEVTSQDIPSSPPSRPGSSMLQNSLADSSQPLPMPPSTHTDDEDPVGSALTRLTRYCAVPEPPAQPTSSILSKVLPSWDEDTTHVDLPSGPAASSQSQLQSQSQSQLKPQTKTRGDHPTPEQISRDKRRPSTQALTDRLKRVRLMPPDHDEETSNRLGVAASSPPPRTVGFADSRQRPSDSQPQSSGQPQKQALSARPAVASQVEAGRFGGRKAPGLGSGSGLGTLPVRKKVRKPGV